MWAKPAGDRRGLTPGGALPKRVLTGATLVCPGTSDCLCSGVEARLPAAVLIALATAAEQSPRESALEVAIWPPMPSSPSGRGT